MHGRELLQTFGRMTDIYRCKILQQQTVNQFATKSTFPNTAQSRWRTVTGL